jgi:Flp pilus assembly protein TadD
MQRELDLALRAMKAGQDKDAERILRRITAAHPEQPEAYANLGIICMRSGRLPEAETALVRAAELDPGNAALQNQLGIAYRNAGKFSQARKAYEAALRIRPDYALAHLNIGILYDLYLGDAGKALQHYEKFQQLQPGEDKQVGKWILDLKQRAQRTSKNG